MPCKILAVCLRLPEETCAGTGVRLALLGKDVPREEPAGETVLCPHQRDNAIIGRAQTDGWSG